jgi:hypothetical protein
MAFLYITEFSDIAATGGGSELVAPHMNSITANQRIDIGGASVQSAAFQPSTRGILINCDTACSIAGGPDPVAVVTEHRMAANETRFYGVQGGLKLAVIENT